MSTNTSTTSIDRRHDLDALRGIAMLLGILLHGAISFIPGTGVFWAVQDSQQHVGFGVMNALIHGFRMPLFFLISGFFTAMLWRKRGLKRLAVHRFKRIFLPMLLGLFTIIPASWIVPAVLGRLQAESHKPATAEVITGESGDAKEDGNAEQSATVESTEEIPLEFMGAIGTGDAEKVQAMIADGINVNATDGEGNTPLHSAVFFGRFEICELLLQAGADAEAVNQEGRTPADVLQAPWWMTNGIAKGFGIELEQVEFTEGRNAIAKMLGSDIELTVDPGSGIIAALTMIPLFGHLWFLWFLCWLVVAFSLVVVIGSKFALPSPPSWLTLSGWRFAWLIPLTALGEYLMDGTGQAEFGPATSLGILPIPAVLAYYAVFFFFGAMYFDAQDNDGVLSKYWWQCLLLGVAVVFPIGFWATHAEGQVLLSVFCQAIYTWLLTIGAMGAFRRWFSAQNPTLRYLSDSSYWLYLAHIPLIYVPQFLVRDWAIWAPLKLAIVVISTTAILLLSYQWFVRYTFLGTLLNGPRRRPGAVSEPAIGQGKVSQGVSSAG